MPSLERKKKSVFFRLIFLLNHNRILSLNIGICMRMAFDHLMFAEKGTMGFVPIVSSCIVPHCANEHNVVLFCCEAACDVIQVDRCTAVFRSPSGQEDVTVQPQHVLGNLFTIVVPPLPFLDHPTRITVDFACGAATTRASMELSRVARAQLPVRPYTSLRHPLHYAAFTGDVTSALPFLDRCS